MSKTQWNRQHVFNSIFCENTNKSTYGKLYTNNLEPLINGNF